MGVRVWVLELWLLLSESGFPWDGNRMHTLSFSCTATRLSWSSFPDMDGCSRSSQIGGTGRVSAHVTAGPRRKRKVIEVDAFPAAGTKSLRVFLLVMSHSLRWRLSLGLK